MRGVVGGVVVTFLVACTGEATPEGVAPGDGAAGAGGTGAATDGAGAATSSDGGAASTRAALEKLAEDGRIDAAAYFNGGREVTPEGAADVNHAGRLFDRIPDGEWACSKSERCDVIVEFSEPFDLEQLVIVGSSGSRIQMPKVVRVEVGPAASGPWTQVASVTPKDEASVQTFPLDAKAARFAHLVFPEHSNDEYLTLDDVQLRGKRATTWTQGWAGTWHEDNNTFIELFQDGDHVWGCVSDGFPVDGTVEGNVFSGTVVVAEGPPAVIGRQVFAMTPDHGLRGVWSNDLAPTTPLENRRDATWHGEPVTTACGKPEGPPPDEFGDQLLKDGHIVLNGVQFDFDKDTLKPSSDAILAVAAKTIQAHPDKAFRIDGHTDNKGGDAYNKDLSDRRAKAVVAWLVAHGCDASKLSTQGHGASSPILPNDTAAGRAQNRRVEIAVN